MVIGRNSHSACWHRTVCHPASLAGGRAGQWGATLLQNYPLLKMVLVRMAGGYFERASLRSLFETADSVSF